MRFITVVIFAFASMTLNAAAQQDLMARPAFVVEQTYWVKPGKELQFMALFEKNRVPLLRSRMKEGHVLWMRLSRPQFNAVNAQQDLRVTVAWRDADSAIERIALAKAQPPKDTQRMGMEQQIMEELIVERTDVPIQQWDVNHVDP